jgi:hypothetical protein
MPRGRHCSWCRVCYRLTDLVGESESLNCSAGWVALVDRELNFLFCFFVLPDYFGPNSKIVMWHGILKTSRTPLWRRPVLRWLQTILKMRPSTLVFMIFFNSSSNNMADVERIHCPVATIFRSVCRYHL